MLEAAVLVGAMLKATMPITPLSQANQSGNALLASNTLSYDGYLSCGTMAKRNNSCDFDVKRKSIRMKAICKAVWTGDFSEVLDPGETLSSTNLALYRNWCHTASQRIREARSEFPRIVNAIDNAKNLDFQFSTNPISSVSLFNSLMLIKSKCSSRSTTTIANTLKIWGTYDIGGWIVDELGSIPGSRYRELNSACNKKGWAYKKIDSIYANLPLDQSQIESGLGSIKTCDLPNEKEQWSEQILANFRDKYSQLLEATNMVGELSLSNSLSEKKLIQDQDLENYRQKAVIESKACSQHISKIENHLIEAKRQKERQEKLNAIKQKEYEAELKRQQFRLQQEQAERLRRQRIETQRQKEIKDSNDSVILD